MGRLPPPDRQALQPEDQAVWDRIAAVRSGVRGPFGVLMHVPQLADRVRALEDFSGSTVNCRGRTASW